MMRAAIVENGKVINIAVASSEYAQEQGWIVAPDDVAIGWLWDGENFIPSLPMEPAALVDEISDRQFFQALYLQGHITKAEALAAIGTGAIPAAMQALIDQLPEEQQEPAEFLLTGATTFKAAHPIADMIRVLFGWSAEQKDEFWRFASTL